MKRFRFADSAVGCLLLLGVTGAFAAPKDITITYQGVLEEEGMPVTRADVAMDFFFHKDETTPLITWSESHTVDVVEGTFTVLLGSSNPFPEGLLADKGEIWLSIRVDGQPLLPRKPFTFTPYAAYSAHAELAAYATDADTVDGKDADELAEADHDHSSLAASDGTPAEALDIDTSGRVGIGDSTQTSTRLGVLGGLTDRYAGYFKSTDWSGDAFALVARAEGTSGLRHYGLLAYATGGDHSNFGVRGIAEGTGSSANYGIYGVASGGAAPYAGYFEGDVGVTGLVNGRDVAADGAVLDSLETGGGSGDPTSDSWIGVDDVHTTSGDVSIGATTSKGNKLNVRSNTSGTASVYGYSDVGVPFSLLYASGTLNAYGVTGWPSDPVRIGVAGRITGLSDGPSVGVYGWTSDDAFQNYGMYALADGAAGGFGVNYGIYAKAVNAGYNYAGYFEGNVGVTGYLKVRGTGSGSGIRLGSDQDFAAIYHTADAVRIAGPNDRLQFGSYHYLEQISSSQSCVASITPGVKIKVGIGTRDPTEGLHVAGSFLTVDGYLSEQAYLGGDGSFDGVMLGSKNAAVSDVALKNRATSQYMDLHVGVLHIHGGADLAEPFAVEDPGDTVKPGLLMAIDPDRPGKLKVADQAYDRKVAGVVSGAGGIKPGMHMIQSDLADDDSVPVALTGRAYAWANADNGPIEPGDLLTTSETPGHAMRVTDHERATGAVIGKAMTGLDDGTGLVLVLVNLQ